MVLHWKRHTTKLSEQFLIFRPRNSSSVCGREKLRFRENIYLNHSGELYHYSFDLYPNLWQFLVGCTGILSYDSDFWYRQKVGGWWRRWRWWLVSNDTACPAFTTVRDIPDILGSLFLIDLQVYTSQQYSKVPSPPPPVIRGETAH